MARLTIFAKGNLDVRDSLHSYSLGGKVLWNGINEVLRQRHPGTLARVRHQVWTNSDALFAPANIPKDLENRKLDLEPYPVPVQYDRSLFTADADAFVLSLQPDAVMPLVRNRRSGHPFYPNNVTQWPSADREWLRENFTPPELMEPDASMRNFSRIVAMLRERTDAPILVYNLSTVVPGDLVHCYEGLDETLATRIRRFNLALVELSRTTGISIVDVDMIVARAGADRVKLDAIHLTAEGCKLIAEDVVRILGDTGRLPLPEHA